MDRKTLPCLQNASQHVPVYLQQFPVIRTTIMQKIAIFTYPGLHFLFALGTPLWQSRKTLHEWKDNSLLAKNLAAWTSCLRILAVSELFEPQVQNNRCFSRTAAHIFVSPGDAPAIITQYVAWMERQFNACQTPSSMYLSIFNSFRVIRCLIQCVSPTRGQSNLTKSASRGAHSPVRGHPRGSKVVPLNSCGMVSY